MATTGGQLILDAVRALRPDIEEAAPKAAADRRLPIDLVEKLRATGVFGMASPAKWGGPELPVLDQLEIIEAVSYADGSAGWCVMIGSDTGYYPQFFDDEVGHAIWDRLDLITAGQVQPVGRAERDGDGWRVSGRWSFGSGVTHADRVVGGAFMVEADGSSGVDENGIPLWKTFVLPRDQVTVHETWNPTGLIGTGSHDYSTEDAFVPDTHGFEALKPGRWEGPLYALPWWFLLKLAAVPLGLAQRALDEVVGIAPTKLVVPEFVMLADTAHARAAVARARATVGSARAYLREVVAAAWDEIERTGSAGPVARADLRLGMLHAATASRDAVALCFDAASTTSIKRGGALDRALRDVNTAAQHITVNQRTYAHIGQVLFGGEPAVPFL